MITFIEYNNVGAIGDEVKLTVNDAAITVYTVAAGKKGVSFQNTGASAVWYGGETTVDPSAKRGNKLYPNQSLVYKGVKNTFRIGFKCETGGAAELAVVNHD